MIGEYASHQRNYGATHHSHDQQCGAASVRAPRYSMAGVKMVENMLEFIRPIATIVTWANVPDERADVRFQHKKYK
jgi:hypothetical protein